MKAMPILLLIPLLSLACADTEAPSAGSEGIIPLAIGNQWVRSAVGWDSTGRPSVSAGADTTRVVRDTTILGERWFLWNTGLCTTNRSSGYWILVGAMPELLLRYPTSPGDSYPYGGDTIRVTASDTSITVAAGTFSCIRYDMLYPTGEFAVQTRFVASNKGEIRREITGRTPSGRVYLAFREDLVAYQLK